MYKFQAPVYLSAIYLCACLRKPVGFHIKSKGQSAIQFSQSRSCSNNGGSVLSLTTISEYSLNHKFV